MAGYKLVVRYAHGKVGDLGGALCHTTHCASDASMSIRKRPGKSSRIHKERNGNTKLKPKKPEFKLRKAAKTVQAKGEKEGEALQTPQCRTSTAAPNRSCTWGEFVS